MWQVFWQEVVTLSRRLTLSLAFAGLSFIWGSTWVFIKIGLNQGWPPFLFAGTRNVIASLLLFAALAALRRPLPRTWRQWWPPLGYGVINGIGMGGVFYGEQYITAGRSAVLTATMPLMALLISRLWLGERVSWRRGCAVVVGIAGVTVAFSDRLTGAGVSVDQRLVAVGQVTCLVATFFYALSNVYSVRHQRGLDVYNNAAVGLLGAGAMQLLLGSLGPLPAAGVFRGSSLWSLLYLAVIGSAAAYVMLFYMLAHLPAVQATYVTMLNPLVAVGLGALFLGEEFGLRAAIGLLLVLAGVWLVSRPELRIDRAAAAD